MSGGSLITLKESGKKGDQPSEPERRASRPSNHAEAGGRAFATQAVTGALTCTACSDGGPCPACESAVGSLTRAAAAALPHASPGGASAPKDSALASAGSPLPTPLRSRFERRLGADLGSVRVHDNARTAASTLGYTRGEGVFLAPGIAPTSHLGHLVLQHELVHVLQQRNGASGDPFSDSETLESEARAGGRDDFAPRTVSGAAEAGQAQFLDAKDLAVHHRVPATLEQEQQWAAELAADQAHLLEIMSSLYYSEADEEAALSILRRWAERRSPSAEERAQRTSFDLRSDLLDRLFESLQHRQVWTLTLRGWMTCYEALFNRFERADEARAIRDQSSIAYVGREARLDEERTKKEEEDRFADYLLGPGANEIEYLGLDHSPSAKKQADWVVARLAEIPSDRLTPMQRALSAGYAREGRDFFLRRYRWDTAGDKYRRGKALARQVVVMVLDYALIELTVGVASAVLPRVIELSLESSRALEVAEVTGTRGALKAGESALGETVSVVGQADRAAAAARLESVAGEGTPLTFYPMRPVNEMAPSTARTLAADTEKVAIKPNPPFGKTPTPIETPEAAFIPPRGTRPNAGLAEARVDAPGMPARAHPVTTEAEDVVAASGRIKTQAGKADATRAIELPADEVAIQDVLQPSMNPVPAGQQAPIPASRKISGFETGRAKPGPQVKAGTLEDLEPVAYEPVGDPTRGAKKLGEREAAEYAAGKDTGYVLSSQSTHWQGRLIGTNEFSVQAGHLVPKSSGAPGGLAIELTSLNQAAETKLISKQAVEIKGAIVERETAHRLLDSGQFPNLTREMIDNAPTHAGWKHPVGMSESEAQAKFMQDQLKVISPADHPLHQLSISYEEMTAHLPTRPMIIPPGQ